MKKDAADRADIVAGLERQLQKGDKSLVGNKGYRRLLANPKGDGFSIDRAKVEEDAKFDGVFVLQTNSQLSPLEGMLVCKKLWGVERTFRTTKSLFETRPTPRLDPGAIRGHVACSLLALELKKELEDRLAAVNNGARASWPAVVADLDSLTETEVDDDSKRFLLRSAPRPAANLALSALGVALPPTLRQVAGA
jgi:IS4 transposase